MNRPRVATTKSAHIGFHPYLSANSVRLAQADRLALSFKNMLLLLNALLLAVLITGGVWALTGRHTSPFEAATVSEHDFSFSVQFFKRATILATHNANYLVARDEQGKKTAIWVTKLESPLSCGGSSRFDYSPPRNVIVHDSCYEPDRLTFASDITVGRQVYQINLTSQKPINVADAKDILGSVIIK